MQEYAAIRDSDAEFERKAKQQANSSLAASGGHIAPIGRRTTGSDDVEREAFKLQPGEISALIATPDGIVVIKCVKRIPADTTVSLESDRPRLYKEIFEKKVQQEIPKAFIDLAKQAKVEATPDRPEQAGGPGRDDAAAAQHSTAGPAGCALKTVTPWRAGCVSNRSFRCTPVVYATSSPWCCWLSEVETRASDSGPAGCSSRRLSLFLQPPTR